MSGMFSGYKTYIVCGLAIITAGAGYLDGDLTAQAAIAAVFAAVSGMTVRAAIAKGPAAK